MAERKTKRNARGSKRRGDFRVCSKPIIRLGEDAQSPDAAKRMALPRVYEGPILFAVARDERTIFACWNIDWRSVFQKSGPVDRQVYLRVFGRDGSEGKRIAVEPMFPMHYLTISGLLDPYRVEIGYYQPAGRWHSVAISEVKTTTQGSSGMTQVDVATIPFHLRFEQLAKLFGPTNATPLATVVSRFQACALNSRPDELSPAPTQVLRKLNLTLPAVAAARRDFEKSDTAKLARRSRALVQLAGASPSHGFQGNAG